MSDNIKLLLVGCGNMAMEYAKVLSHMKISFDVIGRSEAKAKIFQDHFPNIKVYHGGLEKFLKESSGYSHAIVASNVVSLCNNTKSLIEAGIKIVLVEKPGIASPQEANLLFDSFQAHKPSLFIAYNRRFLASVLKAQEIIKSDGGIKSFHFEFTEWSNVIEKLECDPLEKQYLFLANSSHVADLAFYLGGTPKKISCFTSGSIDWHPSSAIFAGSGITKNDILFSYHSNWQSAGRWALEIMTDNHRLIFKPMEKLQVQVKNSVAVNFYEDIDYSIDEKFKPGLYLQVKNFLTGNYKDLCSFEEQVENVKIYNKMCNY